MFLGPIQCPLKDSHWLQWLHGSDVSFVTTTNFLHVKHITNICFFVFFYSFYFFNKRGFVPLIWFFCQLQLYHIVYKFVWDHWNFVEHKYASGTERIIYAIMFMWKLNMAQNITPPLITLYLIFNTCYQYVTSLKQTTPLILLILQ